MINFKTAMKKYFLLFLFAFFMQAVQAQLTFVKQ